MHGDRIEQLSVLERIATYKAWTSQCFADGAWLHLYRLRNDLPVSTVGGAEFQHFLTEELSVLDIERIAVCVGEDAAVGLAVREMIERGEKVDARIVRKVLAFITPLEG